MTEAALGSPESRVEDVIYPAVPGGYRTLVQLLQEHKAKGTSYRQHKQRVFKASYTNCVTPDARPFRRQRGWTIPARDAGGASAILWAWSTCPECRDRRWTG
ncbi:hypothetical protein GCM10009555_010060 [Acrocarpospora macrocephala]|uniref:Uncharacterized protein n=1 Tax=Acrocarpospora macrocephala TaxID=150177 RepID=A0A5M3WQY4_9ACTN|nr:hypothetical protein [Acrocarpospora macrocephala]GES10539.1 hypothetical protein Amac_041360 [Acrocarpospora macrocephala]